MLKLPPYKNEPFTDFSLPENQSAYREALAYVRSTFGRTYPLVIGSERIETPEKIASVNPSKTSEVIGYTAKARIEDAEKALQVGWDAWQEWKNWSMDARARVLVKAAALLRRRKHQFSALLTLEAGKNWAEADGDTAEAIDFLEYYARQSMKYATAGETYDFPNEENRLQHIPLGVGGQHLAMEFPAGDLRGHAGRSDRGGQLRDRQARRGHWPDRRLDRGSAARSGPACGRADLFAGPR